MNIDGEAPVKRLRSRPFDIHEHAYIGCDYYYVRMRNTVKPATRTRRARPNATRREREHDDRCATLCARAWST